MTVGAFALRLATIGQSLDGDELFTYANTVHRSLGHALQADNENNPPAFYLLAWAAAKLGDATITIRVPSLVLGTALVPIVVALGARTVGRTAGLLGAAMIALDPFSVFYAVEARAYAALTFAAALSTLALLAALDTGRRRWWVIYVVASCAVVYTHYLGVFVLATQVAWALWAHRDQLRALVVTSGVIGLGCLPLVPSVLGGRGELLPDRPVTATSMIRELARLCFGHPQIPWDEVPGRVAAFVFLGVVAAALGLTIARMVGRFQLSPRVLLLVALAATTPIGFLVYSLAGPSIVLGRYMLPAQPALALVLAALVVSLPRMLAPAAAVGLLATLGAGAFAALEPDHRRPDFKDAAGYVNASARQGDTIVDSDVGGLTAAKAFLKGGVASSSQSRLAIYLRDRRGAIPRVSTLSTAVSSTAIRRRVFLVGPTDRLERPVGLPLRRLDERTFRGVGTVSVQVYMRTRGRSSLPDSRKVAAVTACLTRQGLNAAPTETRDRAAGIGISLRGGARGLVLLYTSTRDAASAVEGVRQIFSKYGGAERRGSSVVGYVTELTASERQRLAACLP